MLLVANLFTRRGMQVLVGRPLTARTVTHGVVIVNATAESEGFEPPAGLPATAFKADPFGHSGNSPRALTHPEPTAGSEPATCRLLGGRSTTELGGRVYRRWFALRRRIHDQGPFITVWRMPQVFPR